MDFDVLVDDCLLTHFSQPSFAQKFILSLANRFEDGKWKAEAFHNFVWDNIVETALSAQERKALSNRHNTSLTKAAANLRLPGSDKGGEIGEIFLYGILRNHFNALPIVPKIFYKQNSNDPAKGSDSVHLVIDKTGGFQIWLGESKFYDRLSSTLVSKTVTSVYEALSSNKLKKEFNIVTSLQDLDIVCADKDLAKRIRAKLDDGISLDDIKDILHVPILILHECGETKTETSLSAKYKATLVTNHLALARQYFEAQDLQCSSIFNYKKVKFHIILFPVPSKVDIVNQFVAEASSWRR